MDFGVETEELAGAFEALNGNWISQRNDLDNKTRFIYRIQSYAELCLAEGMADLSDSEKQYALHRWYNHKTSKVCERIFINYGAKRASEQEDYMEHIDLFIGGIPFDIKLSVFPSNPEINRMNLDMKKRCDRNKLIEWFYENQSSGQRRCYNNRIIVVCYGKNKKEKYWLKQNFDQMDVKIQAYLCELAQNDYKFNEVEIKDKDGKSITVKADVIIIYSS